KVTYNFQVSDQKDEIDFKAKYLRDNAPSVITWVKIDVIPENISMLTAEPEEIQATVGHKPRKAFRLFLGDNNDRPVPGVFLDVRCIAAPAQENKQSYSVRLKTNRQGVALFQPQLGKVAGKYRFQVNMGSLNKQVTIEAVATSPQSIKLMRKSSGLLAVGSTTDDFSFKAFDSYGNRLRQGLFYFNILSEKKVVRNAFNGSVRLDEDGIGQLQVTLPKNAGKYWLFVTDSSYRVKAFSSVRTRESSVSGVELLNPLNDRIGFRAGEIVKDAFAYRVIDKYNNPLGKIPMSLDIFEE
ncbi:MAG: hypothetical protein AABZ14_02150, partial [Candidatus Margulisiibacteriota bacterium]